MATELFEIVALPSGDIALRRAGEDAGEPLVTIRFSAETLDYLGDAHQLVAKAMIEAGMEAASELFSRGDHVAAEEEALPEKTLH